MHPDDAYARRVEKEFGKTEAWYILDAEEGAELIYGFRREIGQEEFRRRIADGTLMEVVNRVPVKKGDLFFIEAGTLHAIGKGFFWQRCSRIPTQPIAFTIMDVSAKMESSASCMWIRR